jgi:hypothetical protein
VRGLHNINVRAWYSSHATDHAVQWFCDHFEIDGLADSIDVEYLTHLDDCPSQGVDRVRRHLLIDLREQLEIGRTYQLTIHVDAIRPGFDSFIFTFTDEMRERLRRDAGDYEEESAA